MIDRYLLRYFLAVIDHGNFSRAAGQLGVSQPTLSAGIAKLERLLGRPLFYRTNRRVELTAAGAHFSAHARRIETEFTLAERSVSQTPSPATLRLGVLASTPSAWLTPAIKATSGAERLELVEGRERDLMEGLARRRIDAALTLLQPESSRFTAEPLLEEGYALALPKTHPLSGETVLPAEALADNTMIVRRHCEVLSETSRHFTSRGVRPFFAARVTNDECALALVAAGLGVTVMPACFEAADVARPQLIGFNYRRTIGLLYGPDFDETARRSSSALEALRSTLAA